MNEGEYLRDLAKKLAEYGADPIQKDKERICRTCNDLRSERPVVFARPENGWPDLHEKWGRLRCSDPFHRTIEERLLQSIIRYEYIKDDMPVLGEYQVPMKILHSTYNDFGVDLEVTDTGADHGAYHMEPAIKEWADMEALHFRYLAVDRAGSREDLERTGDLIGNELDVYQVGVKDWRYGLTRILIHMRGFEQFLFDLHDYPDEIHKLMAFLRDNFLAEMDFYRQEGLVTPNTGADDYIGVGGPCVVSSLPKRQDKASFDVGDCVVWAEAQETVNVSPSQFEEFVFRYQKPLAEKFGLSGYGCCEGLEDRFEVVERGLPNLRWVAVSPWADAENLAEQIGKKYVYLYKANPALVVQPTPDWEAAEKQVRDVLDMTRGMAVQISLKDTNTFCHEPERISRWVRMVKRLVEE